MAEEYAVWTVEELEEEIDAIVLDKHHRAHLISSNVEVSKKRVSRDISRAGLVGTRKRTFEQSSVIVANSQREKVSKHLKDLNESGGFDEYERSAESSLCLKLKRRNWAKENKVEGEPKSVQRRLLRYFEKSIDFDEQTIDWERLPAQFLEAKYIKSFNQLNHYQKGIFFLYVQEFFEMIQKRGIKCLYDESVYCCGSVIDWLQRLIFLSEVEAVKHGKFTCLVRPDVKGRPAHSIKMNSKTVFNKTYSAQTYASLISTRNEDYGEEYDEIKYGASYDSAHFVCNFERCLSTAHIKRQRPDENHADARGIKISAAQPLQISNSEDSKIEFYIRHKGEFLPVSLYQSAKVSELNDIVECDLEIEPDKQVLKFRGTILDPEQSISHYGIRIDDEILLTVKE